MPKAKQHRLAVRATESELAEWRAALAVAMPEAGNPSAAVRAILEAVVMSPHFAREVLADVLIPGGETIAPARRDFEASLAEDRDAVARSSKVSGKPRFEGEAPYAGTGESSRDNPCDSDKLWGGDRWRGPLGRAVTARRLANRTADFYRYKAEAIRAGLSGHSRRMAGLLDAALDRPVTGADGAPVFVMSDPATGRILALADSRDDADRILLATAPERIEDAVGKWRPREPWLTLWKREGGAFELEEAKRRLLAEREG